MVPLLLIMLAFIGGCAGSTAGGMKVIRVVLLYKHSVREIHRLIHPHAVLPVKFGGQKASEHVIDAVMGFFFLFVATTALMTLMLYATGLDMVTAFSAVAACITNLGPGLGEVGKSYTALSDTAKLLLAVAMLAGRLEIYTLLVLLTPGLLARLSMSNLNLPRTKLTPLLCALALGACAHGGSEGVPDATPQAGLQNECVKIADRSERERCLLEAQFGPNAGRQ